MSNENVSNEIKKEDFFNIFLTKYNDFINLEVLKDIIVKNMNNNDFVKIQNKIISMKNKNIVFDNNFYTIKDNMYYCSEFVCEILNSTKKFNFIITKKKLSGLDSIYLKRDTLKYIPVDIFLNRSPFELIKKWEN